MVARSAGSSKRARRRYWRRCASGSACAGGWGSTFAAIAALTALSVAQVFSRRAESAIRDRGVELAIGQTRVGGVSRRRRRCGAATSSEAATLIADRRRFSLWVFARGGSPLTSTVVAARRLRRRAERGRGAALGARRAAGTSRRADNGQAIVVGPRLPGFGGAIVTYTQTPELQAAVGVVQDEIVTAALAAVVLGAVVGLLVASLIATRLRRIARAAADDRGGRVRRRRCGRASTTSSARSRETIDRMRCGSASRSGDLEGERDRLRQLLEGLQEGVVAVDRDLRVAFANRAARRCSAASRSSRASRCPSRGPTSRCARFAARAVRRRRRRAAGARDRRRRGRSR